MVIGESYTIVRNRLGKAAARRRLERGPGCGAGDGEHGGADNRPQERAGLQSVIDSERQPTGVDLGGAGYGEHGGADNRPPGHAGLQSLIDSAASMIRPKRPFFAEKDESFTRSELRNKI